MKEIGSNFWMYNTGNEKEKYFLPQIHCNNHYFFSSGRMAIYSLIKHLKYNNSTVLLPFFTCESVIEPFLKNKCRIIFYGIDDKLNLNIDEIKQIVIEHKPKLILFHSYYGFNTNLKLNNKLVPFLREKKVCIVEDLTQAYFSSFKKINADFYVSSLRKFFAIPSGGVIFSPNQKLNIQYDNDEELLSHLDAVALSAFNLKKEYMSDINTKVKKEDFLKKYSEIKNCLNIFGKTLPISPKALTIYKNINYNEIIALRRKNFKYLLKKLSFIKGINPMFDKLPNNVVPLYFPMFVEIDRKSFQQAMANKNIYCPIIWPKSKYIEYNNKENNSLYSKLICIPCDQRYSINDMKYICDCIFEIISP